MAVEPEEPTDPTLTEVTLQLNWFPEVEHGGYYAALVHGFYKEAGLRVKIVPGGPETPVVQQVARRSVTFGVVNADYVLFGRAQQAPVVAVMAPLQTSPRCLIVHADSNIREFSELKNMTIAMSSSNAFSQYLQYKLPLKNVKIVPYPGNVAQFLLNKNYAQQGYVFSEPFVARKEGADPRVLMLSSWALILTPVCCWCTRTRSKRNRSWCARWSRPVCAVGSSTSRIRKRPTSTFTRSIRRWTWISGIRCEDADSAGARPGVRTGRHRHDVAGSLAEVGRPAGRVQADEKEGRQRRRRLQHSVHSRPITFGSAG